MTLTAHHLRHRRRLSRRTLVRWLLVGSLSHAVPGEAAAATQVRVMAPEPPDPAPPGLGHFAETAFADWQRENDVSVAYEGVAWQHIHDKLAVYFERKTYFHDLIYTAGWVPEFAGYLTPLTSNLLASLRTDMPPSALGSSNWAGATFGYPTTLSLLTLFFNREHLDVAGLSGPPATWDELKRYAAELTRDGRSGWVCNYATPTGIGGTASYWMAFLQQAGGRMYDTDGLPAFGDSTGVDALQFMVDLMPSTHPASLTHTGIDDATVSFMKGEASMMMNWPFMWQLVQDPALSSIIGRVGSSILPAGPAGSASIDGADSWSVPTLAQQPELAVRLLRFYLEPRVQRDQAIETGWLPIRLSVLREPRLQASVTNAATVVAQASFPYSSFLTPDYAAITSALGSEIQLALRGVKTSKQAIGAAVEAVRAIVLARPKR